MNRYHLDLFSGIGGFALAAQWAGFTTVAFCEIDKYAQQILKERFGAVSVTDAIGCAGRADNQGKTSAERNGPAPRLHGDIFALDGTQYAGVDLITGGFPCQPFSCAGKRRGKADDRAIWPEMRRVIAEARPRWVLAENVPGIITMELDNCLSDLEALGYTTGTLVVPACAVDARHRRDRVWIVGHAAGTQPIRTGEGLPGTRRSEFGLGCPSQAMADTHSSETTRQREHGGKGLPKPEPELAGQAGNVAHSATTRLQTPWTPGETCGTNGGTRPAADGSCRWQPEPDVGRVANGVPKRVDRLKGLGNAIVPQVAYEIIRLMT